MLRVRFVFIALLIAAILAGASQAAAAQKVAVTIEADKTGEPICEYIYGQFIEHLGRCIYGGIWAEMLEDRKFYFPITPEYDPYRESRGVAKDALLPVVGASPWQITGADDSVMMAKPKSFVGEHTPLIEPGSGIRHLLKFKRGFGGRLVRTVGAWDLVYAPLRYRLYSAAVAWRERRLAG